MKKVWYITTGELGKLADNWIKDTIHPGGSWKRDRRPFFLTQPAPAPKQRWIYKLKKEGKNVSPK